ncbi:MAG: hypothetical protein ABI216_21005 [Devosia sp.]
MTRPVRLIALVAAGASLSLCAGALAAPAAPFGTAATGVVCQIAKSGKLVHVEALNKDTTVVPAGDSFAFTIVGPTKKTDETITFKRDLAPGKTVSITNAIKAKNVVGCTPSA